MRDELPRITPAMIQLYDDYTHVTLDRRGFMDRLAKLAGSGAAAAAILPLLAANRAKAQITPEDDERLVVDEVSFDGPDGALAGYLAMPADAGSPLSGVLVVHENRGLNPHIRDVTRRMALEGFVALGLDFLSTAGGTPEDEDEARTMIADLDGEVALRSGLAALRYLREHEATNGSVGAIGFCWGGGMVNRLAVSDPELDAAVAFYGPAPDAAAVANIRARLLLHYAGLDERINAGIPDFRAALDDAGVDYELHMYEGTNHAFHNDTSAARYDAPAAELAWSRTVAFLHDSLAN